MKKKFLGTALAAALTVTFMGCEIEMDPEPISSPRSGQISTEEDMGEEYAGFEVEKPGTFDGEFNPTSLEEGVEEGKLAPEIVGKDLDGIEFKLSDYRGKVVMLDFWGDW